MVPLSTLTTYTVYENAPLISHYNLFRSAEIDGSPKPGYSSGDALTALKQVADGYLASRLRLRVFRVKPRGIIVGQNGLYLFAFQSALCFVPGCII